MFVRRCVVSVCLRFWDRVISSSVSVVELMFLWCLFD